MEVNTFSVQQSHVGALSHSGSALWSSSTLQTQCRQSRPSRCSAIAPGAPPAGHTVCYSRSNGRSLETYWSASGGLHHGPTRFQAPKHQVLCRATQQQQQQKLKQQQLPLQWPADLELREAELLEAASDEAYSGPILSGAGGGLFFWWELGAVKYLQQRYDLTAWQMRGASAGALVATLAACNVGPDQALICADRLARENGIFERKLGLAGVWGNLVRQWLDEVLPDNAAEMCRGRLKLVVTDVSSFQLAYIDDFATKAELIDANMASAHIPFFLDWRPYATYRGKPYIDGSVTDFIYYDNSPLLKCNGQAFILDYSQDELLKAERVDFIRQRDYEGIQELMAAGYAYAQRMEAAGRFETLFGGQGALRAPDAAVFT